MVSNILLHTFTDLILDFFLIFVWCAVYFLCLYFVSCARFPEAAFSVLQSIGFRLMLEVFLLRPMSISTFPLLQSKVKAQQGKKWHIKAVVTLSKISSLEGKFISGTLNLFLISTAILFPLRILHPEPLEGDGGIFSINLLSAVTHQGIKMAVCVCADNICHP